MARRYHDVQIGSTPNEVGSTPSGITKRVMLTILGCPPRRHREARHANDRERVVPLFRQRPLRTALVATAWGGLIALVAAGVRVLPWMIDPRVPWTVLVPFARSIALVGGEAALLVGAPIGWALAASHAVETRESRVFALLGEPPWRTSLRALPQIAVLAGTLALVSLLGGRDANAPGRVVTELVARGRDSCGHATAPSTQVVPFLSAEWLCAPGREPRLVATAPIGAALVTAKDAVVAGDFRRIDLSDARFAVGAASVHVGALILRGLPPWARASTLPPWLRALLMALSLGVALATSGFAIERIRARVRFAAVAIGAAGPLAALGLLRALERRDAHAITYASLPAAAFAAVVVATLAIRLWQRERARRLLSPEATASK